VSPIYEKGRQKVNYVGRWMASLTGAFSIFPTMFDAFIGKDEVYSKLHALNSLDDSARFFLELSLRL
jgi:hypothetical protein